MNKLRVKDILKVTNGMLLCGNKEEECINFCKDTRTIEKDDIYDRILMMKGLRK